MPFSEVSAHRASLEEAYLELTADAVEFRAEPADGDRGGREMTATTVTPRWPGTPPTGHADRSAELLRAEWIKFRTVRGWVIAMVIAAVVTAGIALLDHSTCGGTVTPGGPVSRARAALPPGRAGRRGRDRQLLLRASAAGRRRQHHRPGDLADRRPRPGWPAAVVQGRDHHHAGTRPGSAYAAMMVTGGHGVRMQYDYTGDIAGPGAGRVRCPRRRRAGCG